MARLCAHITDSPEEEEEHPRKKGSKAAPTNRKLDRRSLEMATGVSKNALGRGRRSFKNDPKRQVERRTAPRRAHDRLGPARCGGVPPVYPHPMGTILAPQNDPKRNRKRSKIPAKNQETKKRSKTILDPSWGDLGHFEGTMLSPEPPKSIVKHTIS